MIQSFIITKEKIPGKIPAKYLKTWITSTGTKVKGPKD